MKLVSHNQINNRFFDRKSRPSRKFWHDAVSQEIIRGLIICGKIYIDETDLLARIDFDNAQPPTETPLFIDLLK